MEDVLRFVQELLYLWEVTESRNKRPERCWGCTSCLKECPVQAIEMFLGEDIGGLGGRLTVCREQHLLHWKVRLPDGKETTITVDSRNSNKY